MLAELLAVIRPIIASLSLLEEIVTDELGPAAQQPPSPGLRLVQPPSSRDLP